MASRKKRPVLYEMRRPEAKNADPSWRPRPSSSSPEVGPTLPTGESETEASPRPRPTFVSATAAATADRWQVTISAPTLAILTAAALVLLAVSFSTGRHYEAFHPSVTNGAEVAQGTSTTDGAGEQAGSGAGLAVPGTGQVDNAAAPSAQRSGTGDTTPPATAAGRRQVTLQKGFHYIVVQHFGKKHGQEAALAAAEFLQNNGVACATLPGADIRLVVTEPFLVNQRDRAAARRERERADQLLAHIKQLGQQFNRELLKQGKKGYTFSGCRLVEIK